MNQTGAPYSNASILFGLLKHLHAVRAQLRGSALFRSHTISIFASKA